MAFRDYANEGAPVPDTSYSQPAGAPSMVPLSLELVPSVLCQSFGVPMHDSQLLARSMGGYGVQSTRSGMDMFHGGFGHPERFQGQFIGAGPHLQYPMGHLEPVGHMNPFGYPLGAAGSGFAPHAYAAARSFQYASACAFQPPHQQQQQQQQQQQHRQQQSQQQHVQQQNSHPQPIHQHLSQQQQAVPGQQQPVPTPHLSFPTSNMLDPGYLRQAMAPQQETENNWHCQDNDVGRRFKRTADLATSGSHGGVAVMEPVKRSRLVWTRDLHECFEGAVEKAGGIDIAVPKSVLEHMSVSGLTRDNVASHLQKHRMHVKKSKECVAPSSKATHSGTQASQPAQYTAETTGGSTCAVAVSAAMQLTSCNAEAAPPSKRACTASGNLTSDSGSGKTAFAVAMRSGVQYTPESRDTGNGTARDLGAGNMASSVRTLGSSGAGSVGAVEGAGLEGRDGSDDASANVEAKPAQTTNGSCTRVTGGQVESGVATHESLHGDAREKLACQATDDSRLTKPDVAALAREGQS